MNQIKWYSLSRKEYFSHELPIGATILSVGYSPTLTTSAMWVLVNVDNNCETRNFRLVKTDKPITDVELEKLNYLGTVDISYTKRLPNDDATFIRYDAHLFEIK